MFYFKWPQNYSFHYLWCCTSITKLNCVFFPQRRNTCPCWTDTNKGRWPVMKGNPQSRKSTEFVSLMSWKYRMVSQEQVNSILLFFLRETNSNDVFAVHFVYLFILGYGYYHTGASTLYACTCVPERGAAKTHISCAT